MKAHYRQRYRLVIRDTERVNAAIANLHRAIVKILDRADKLPVGDPDVGDAVAVTANRLALAQTALGHVLSYLDEAVAQEREFMIKLRRVRGK